MPEKTFTCVKCGTMFVSTHPNRRNCDACVPSKKVVDPANAAERRARKARQSAAPEGMKWCGYCDNYLPLAQFKLRHTGKPEAYCYACRLVYQHATHVKKTYGIDLDEYTRMLELQNNRCAICLQRPRTKRLAVDHDHQTGLIRGLLCRHCNHSLLGAAHDRVELLLRAAEYLRRPPAVEGTVEHLAGPFE